jgi:hypothetical protein
MKPVNSRISACMRVLEYISMHDAWHRTASRYCYHEPFHELPANDQPGELVCLVEKASIVFVRTYLAGLSLRDALSLSSLKDTDSYQQNRKPCRLLYCTVLVLTTHSAR